MHGCAVWFSEAGNARETTKKKKTAFLQMFLFHIKSETAKRKMARKAAKRICFEGVTPSQIAVEPDNNTDSTSSPSQRKCDDLPLPCHGCLLTLFTKSFKFGELRKL